MEIVFAEKYSIFNKTNLFEENKHLCIFRLIYLHCIWLSFVMEITRE